MKNLISMDKQYKTRSGSEVRILCIDSGCEEYPVVAVVNKDALKFTAEGKYWSDGDTSDHDLIEVPKETEVWLEIYEYEGELKGRNHLTKEDLDFSVNATIGINRYKLIATKKITVVEGERV